MDLGLSEDDEFLAETVRSFVARDGTTEKLVALQKSATGSLPGWQKTMADAGWTGALLPGELGGADATALQGAILSEELGRGPIPGPFLASSVVSTLLLRAADASAARDGLLKAIAAGDAVVVAVLGEGGSGPDGFRGAPDAIAESSAQLTATVPFVPYAGDATHFLVPLLSPTGGLEFAIVDVSADGVRRRELTGFLARNFEVEFDGASVDALVTCSDAELDRGLAQIYVTAAAYSVGGCQALLEKCVDYSRTRIQFGNPIGKFQRVQDHIVELVNALDGARWAMYEAIWRIDSGRDARASAHMTKALASEAYVVCTDAAHKVHGGIGVDPDFGLTLYTQTARSMYNYLGNPRWHKRAMADALGWAAR